jgi:hypothetical protein
MVLVLAPLAMAGEDDGLDINIFVGQKALDRDDWAPVQDQLEPGIQLSVPRGPVHIAADVLFSSDNSKALGTSVKGKTWEANLGVRKFWGQRIRPYVGGGLSLVTVEFDPGISASTDQDPELGYWAGTGILFRLGKHFNLGVTIDQLQRLERDVGRSVFPTVP